MVNKDPLSLSINDQTCDVSHSCVTGCANILSAKGNKEMRSEMQVQFIIVPLSVDRNMSCSYTFMNSKHFINSLNASVFCRGF